MKLYTTAKELVKPTARYVARKLKGATNGGVALKEVRRAVLEEYKPMMTIIDGHHSGGKNRMIDRSFNSMIYAGYLAKSGYGVYDKATKEVYITDKAVKEFGVKVRLSQLDLVIPALVSLRDLAVLSEDGRVKSSDLLKALNEQVAQELVAEDMAINKGNQPKYRQIIRNLISNRVLDKTGLVKYHADTKEFELMILPIAA
ncbi:hypothetical protein [Serratia sp. Se-RSBMAAmG]|uniref:hypothetical protein n=1 Tax=Serratia sp. Se-RSBMAAmG TaxID=3043305 RepID=UPI0024AF959D|nr:hypothetical protein [Serratia sp. Se-RSBMAAmG]MDI6977140.1 hypothetical protein [Serratia sp. Se-RSBMAAmG]